MSKTISQSDFYKLAGLLKLISENRMICESMERAAAGLIVGKSQYVATPEDALRQVQAERQVQDDAYGRSNADAWTLLRRLNIVVVEDAKTSQEA